MNITPRYDLAPGTEVTVNSRTIVVNEASDDGYAAVDKATGRAEFLPYHVFAHILKQPGYNLSKPPTKMSSKAALRLGTYQSVKALPSEQQLVADFRIAVCFAIAEIHKEIRHETDDPTFLLSQRKLNCIELRARIAQLASTKFGKKIHTDLPAGGHRLIWSLPKGRRLNEWYNEYLACLDAATSEDTYDLAAALVPLDHKKGNRNRRITWLVRDLMSQAIDRFAREPKENSIANLHDHLVTLINEENKRRVANDLEKLSVPSPTTLSRHQDELYSPTEALVRDQGKREAQRQRGRGSTDIRALKIGEYTEMDEVLLSLVMTAKVCGLWARLAAGDKAALEHADEVIRTRLVLLVLLDVATRMPLAWVVSDQPRAEATLALLRMATRDKTKEMTRYGCTGSVVEAVGLGLVKNDNGPGLRNAEVKAAILGCGGVSEDARTYSPTDKPFIERHFGTLEAILLKILHGYTGRRPGELRGYDANKSGVLDIEAVYELLTCFYIDELPSMRHHGFGMWGRRPAEVYKEINKTRGMIAPIDPDVRRIHLCWEEKVKPNDEGVRVFSGFWFNSDALQAALEDPKAYGRSSERKVSVFVDPDNLNEATVVLPKTAKPIKVELQTTAFADLSINEALNLVMEYRKENPTVTEIHEDRLAKVRRTRANFLDTIGVEKGLARSYQTQAEIKRKASEVFRGSRLVGSKAIPGTVPAGQITAERPDGMVFDFSGDDAIIEATAMEPEADETVADSQIEQPGPSAEIFQHQTSKFEAQKRKMPDTEKPPAQEISPDYLGRPKNPKRLE